eukprot:9006050-Pyramimonas_sp.AAC.1
MKATKRVRGVPKWVAGRTRAAPLGPSVEPFMGVTKRARVYRNRVTRKADARMGGGRMEEEREERRGGTR